MMFTRLYTAEYIAENATSRVAGRRTRNVSTMTAAPTPTPTSPENAETNELNQANGPTDTDWTATSMGRSKKKGVGCTTTASVSARNRAPVTSATHIRTQLMSPVSR